MVKNAIRVSKEEFYLLNLTKINEEEMGAFVVGTE